MPYPSFVEKKHTICLSYEVLATNTFAKIKLKKKE